jgi:hypothetical protein
VILCDDGNPDLRSEVTSVKESLGIFIEDVPQK